MTNSSRSEAEALLRLSAKFKRIAVLLANLATQLEAVTAIVSDTGASSPEASRKGAQWIIDARKLRSMLLPSGLFAEPAWDMLIELLRVELAGQRISQSDLSMTANVPETTARRFINALAQQNFIIRTTDPFDSRRVHLELSRETSKMLRSYVAIVFGRTFSNESHYACAGASLVGSVED